MTAATGRPAVRPAAGRPAAPGPSPRLARGGGWRTALPVRIWKRQLPPVRLVWIFLLVLVWNGGGFLSQAVATPLLALPAVAAAVDVGLQWTRYPKLRFPDAAIANGLFLSLILWPAEFSVELAAVVAATVAFRHLVRSGGHPWFNPAAVGVTLAATVFALPQPWHFGYTLNDTLLIALLGLVLWSRAKHGWRLWAVYFAANLATGAAVAFLLGGHAAVPIALQAALLGPAPVFFGLFMVTEPRTAPSARWAMTSFGVLVGVGAALFPPALALVPVLSPLGVLAPYLALFVGNGLAVASRAHRAPRPSTARPAPRAA